MTTEIVIGLVAVLVVIALLAAAVTAKIVLGLMRGPLESRIAAHYKPDEVIMKDLKANSFGLESAGVMQLRGNGGLVLTQKQLHFFMFVPKREICIPLSAISEFTFTKSHLGKATIYDLLKVRFSSEGESDSVAWYVTDPAAWKSKIEQLQAKAAM
jgi:hypothetical protein